MIEEIFFLYSSYEVWPHPSTAYQFLGQVTLLFCCCFWPEFLWNLNINQTEWTVSVGSDLRKPFSRKQHIVCSCRKGNQWIPCKNSLSSSSANKSMRYILQEAISLQIIWYKSFNKNSCFFKPVLLHSTHRLGSHIRKKQHLQTH